jgi:hypothetical protein
MLVGNEPKHLVFAPLSYRYPSPELIFRAIFTRVSIADLRHPNKIEVSLTFRIASIAKIHGAGFGRYPLDLRLRQFHCVTGRRLDDVFQIN